MAHTCPSPRPDVTLKALAREKKVLCSLTRRWVSPMICPMGQPHGRELIQWIKHSSLSVSHQRSWARNLLAVARIKAPALSLYIYTSLLSLYFHAYGNKPLPTLTNEHFNEALTSKTPLQQPSGQSVVTRLSWSNRWGWDFGAVNDLCRCRLVKSTGPIIKLEASESVISADASTKATVVHLDTRDTTQTDTANYDLEPRGRLHYAARIER